MFAIWLASLGVAATPTSGPHTIPLAVDAEARTVTIGPNTEPFLTPQLSALPTQNGVRLLPSAGGMAVPERWFLKLQIHDSKGGVSDFKAGLRTGRGRPPLFLDFDLPPLSEGSVYVAQLAFRARQGEASSRKRVLPRPGRRTVGVKWLGRVRARTLAADLAPLISAVKNGLHIDGTFIAVRGHWSPAEDAEAQSEVLANQIAGALRAAGVAQDRVRVQALGAQFLRFPTLTRSMAQRNRRAELIRMPAPTLPIGRILTDVPPRQLELRIDAHEDSVDLSDTPTRNFSIDLDPPALIHLTLHDGRGGHAYLRRGIAPRRIRTAPAAEHSSLQRPDVKIVGGQMLLRAEGPQLVVEMAAPDSINGWLVTVQNAQADVVAQAGGGGCPPPRLDLALTASVAQSGGLQVLLHTRLKKRGRARTRPIAVPRLTVVPSQAHCGAGEDPGSAFGRLLQTLQAHSSAQIRVIVHGGRSKARKKTRARLESAAKRRGIALSRFSWSAGRALGGLMLEGHLFEALPLAIPVPNSDAP